MSQLLVGVIAKTWHINRERFFFVKTSKRHLTLKGFSSESWPYLKPQKTYQFIERTYYHYFQKSSHIYFWFGLNFTLLFSFLTNFFLVVMMTFINWSIVQITIVEKMIICLKVKFFWNRKSWEEARERKNGLMMGRLG